MKLKVKRLSPQAVLPKRAMEGDAGLDLVAVSEIVEDGKMYGYIEYKTGLAITPPPGYFLAVVPRSSISKTGLWQANSIGVIDPGYTGEITVRFKYIPRTDKYKPGDRIGQLLVLPLPKIEVEEVEALAETERGALGFGSSGS